MSYHFDPKTALSTQHRQGNDLCPICARARETLDDHPDRTRPGADPMAATVVIPDVTDFDLVSPS
jgi:hypothetical protein